jgi:hypothetical protein
MKNNDVMLEVQNYLTGFRHCMNLANMTHTQKSTLLLGIIVFALIAVLFVPVYPQDSSYHQFADQRRLLGIPNLWNVISNIPFIIVAYLGLNLLVTNPTICIYQDIYWVYRVFFIGVFFVGLGSGYYHLFPSNNTLIFDRLPMTVAFMAFFTIIVSEFISVSVGKLIFIPLLVLGIFSVWYWYITEQQGVGDLRLYGLVQFVPILLTPLIIGLFISAFSHNHLLWYFLAAYLLAKLFEATDASVYQYLFHLISGHTIKHIIASIACYIFYRYLKQRLPINAG